MTSTNPEQGSAGSPNSGGETRQALDGRYPALFDDPSWIASDTYWLRPHTHPISRKQIKVHRAAESLRSFDIAFQETRLNTAPIYTTSRPLSSTLLATSRNTSTASDVDSPFPTNDEDLIALGSQFFPSYQSSVDEGFPVNVSKETDNEETVEGGGSRITSPIQPLTQAASISRQFFPPLTESEASGSIIRQLIPPPAHSTGTDSARKRIVFPSIPTGTGASRIGNGRRYQELVQDPSEFAYHWEKQVIPYLLEQVACKMPGSSSINVFAGSAASQRVVVFTTPVPIDANLQGDFRDGLTHALPLQFRGTLDFQFTIGRVAHCVATPDPICDELNPYWRPNPMGGDSAGVAKQVTGGTLHLRFQIDGESYWIVPCHILAETLTDKPTKWHHPSEIRLCQPATADYAQFCKGFNQHAPRMDPPSINNLGHLVAWSGTPYKTVCRSRTRGDSVVTDWAAFKTDRLDLSDNSIRAVESRSTEPLVLPEICRGSSPIPGQRVNAAGRTSGYTDGCISLVPALVLPSFWNWEELIDGYEVKRMGNSTGVPTREWSVAFFPSEGTQTYQKWVTSGAGKQGDSGSPVVNTNDNSVCGMIWGRNEYSDCEAVRQFDGRQFTVHYPRIAYFTSYDDLCDDIQDKMKSLRRPELPSAESRLRASEDRHRAQAAREATPIRSSAVMQPQKKKILELPPDLMKILVPSAADRRAGLTPEQQSTQVGVAA